jgi:hypothetical protein
MVKNIDKKTFFLLHTYVIIKIYFCCLLKTNFCIMSGLRNFFFSPKRLGFHILLAIGVFIVICVTALFVLDSYTRHGTEVVMPNFIGMDSNELLNKEAASKDFIIVVSDYLFDRKTAPGTVLKQDPHVGEMVKKGRDGEAFRSGYIYCRFTPLLVGLDSTAGIASRYRLDGSRIESR